MRAHGVAACNRIVHAGTINADSDPATDPPRGPPPVAPKLKLPAKPAARGLTVAEKRSLAFERISLYVVFLVAVIAAIISFVALTYVGSFMGLSFAAWLLPVAIDGFAIACSVGIVRSQAEGEKGRERINEWLGLLLALGLSVTGNIWHVLEQRGPELPAGLASAFAAAPPLIVAYGIHVYGRALVRGVSSHVMADNPNELRFDLEHLGDDESARTLAQAAAPTARGPQRAPRAQTPITRASEQPVRAEEPAARTQSARTIDLVKAEEARAPKLAAPSIGAPVAEVPTTTVSGVALKPNQRAVYAAFLDAVRADPSVEPDAKAMQMAAAAKYDPAAADIHPATPRRWRADWYAEWKAVNGEVDRDAEQLEAERPAEARITA